MNLFLAHIILEDSHWNLQLKTKKKLLPTSVCMPLFRSVHACDYVYTPKTKKVVISDCKKTKTTHACRIFVGAQQCKCSFSALNQPSAKF